MKRFLLFSATAFLLLAAVSCVPLKKFKEEQKRNEELSKENTDLKAKNDSLHAQIDDLNLSIEKKEKQIRQLAQDTANLTIALLKAQMQYKDALTDYESLQKNNAKLLANNTQENMRLINELRTAQNDLAAREKVLADLQKSLSVKQTNMDQLNSLLEQRQKRLNELESIVGKQDSILTSLKNSLNSALDGFIKDGLSINVKNGVIYVSMEEKLLFKTGSTSVDSKGQDALRKLGKVLENQPDINILIEGHTDNAKVLDGSIYKDNWDLSVLRATAVIRILKENAKIDPKRLIASGRSEFLPLDPANTKDAKTKNRRTEIILSPKLDELYKLLDAKKTP